MQGRTILVRKKDLATKLQKIPAHPAPRVSLEQYTIPSELAADILFSACYAFGDIERKTVVDLGTGTGRLAAGCAILGASFVVGVDIDPVSIATASRNSRESNFEVQWILGDIESLNGKVDTVLMNPPFGTRRKHADIAFLKKGAELGKVVYSIHKSSTRGFISRWANQHGQQSQLVLNTKMEIPHQFGFHHKKRVFVDVDVFRMSSTGS